MARSEPLTNSRCNTVRNTARSSAKPRQSLARTIAGVAGLDLHHLYRAMAWLGEELPEQEPDGRTPFAPRCRKDVVEERLFAHRRDLLTRLPGVHGQRQPLLRRCRLTDAGPARLRPSPRPAADHSCGLDRRRRSAGLLGDVAGQHRRRQHLHSGASIGCASASTLRACAWSPTAA
jgi:hypothetical protein